MEWPQMTVMGILFVGLGINLARDGEARRGKHSFGWTLFAVFLEFWLLYEGGFWSGGQP